MSFIGSISPRSISALTVVKLANLWASMNWASELFSISGLFIKCVSKNWSDFAKSPTYVYSKVESTTSTRAGMLMSLNWRTKSFICYRVFVATRSEFTCIWTVALEVTFTSTTNSGVGEVSIWTMKLLQSSSSSPVLPNQEFYSKYRSFVLTSSWAWDLANSAMKSPWKPRNSNSKQGSCGRLYFLSLRF